MQSNLLSRGWTVTIVLSLFACAQSALDLPEDYGSVDANRLNPSMFDEADLRKECGDIENERLALKDQRVAIDKNIVASREGDQLVGYIASVAFPPLWLALDNDSEKKQQLIVVQKRLDMLTKLTRFRSCYDDLVQGSRSSFEKELDQLDELKERGALSEKEYSLLRLGVFKKYFPTADM